MNPTMAPTSVGRREATPAGVTSEGRRYRRNIRQEFGEVLLGAGSDALHEFRLAVGGLVLVDDAFGRCLVETLDREAQRIGSVLGPDAFYRGLHACLELAADGFVPLLSLGVGEDSFLLALDVGHGLFEPVLPVTAMGELRSITSVKD